MLRTNSKKAKENLKKYCIESSIDYLEENYGYTVTEKNIYSIIKEVYNIETWDRIRNRHCMTFETWAGGLPCGGLFDYYLHDAIGTAGKILEETEEERNRYTETEAENLMTALIKREVIKA